MWSVVVSNINDEKYLFHAYIVVYDFLLSF